MLVDMIGKTITGKDAEAALGRAHITVNKNAVPNDPQKPFVTSGLRIGTPSVSTQGMGEPEMAQIAALIARTLRHRDDDAEVAAVRDDVRVLCEKFPVYGAPGA
jgi:glycine hydroxymethyltransferase